MNQTERAAFKSVIGGTWLILGCFSLLMAIPVGMSLASDIPVAISYPCNGSIVSVVIDSLLLLLAVGTTSGAFAGAAMLARRKRSEPVKSLESAPDLVPIESNVLQSEIVKTELRD